MLPPPEVPARDETVLEGAHPLNGVTIANLSPAVADELGMPFAATGVVVIKPAPTRTQLSFAAKDVVVGVSGIKTETVEDLVRVLKKPSRGWEISVRRNGQIRTVRIIR